jgi:hypothetical protein
MALVFDTLVIDNSWYGLEVFRRLIPLFSRDSNHSVLAGDYIDTGAGQELLFEAIQSAVTLTRHVDYRHSSQFYIIYINNQTDRMVRRFHEGLCGWAGYVGYADTTYSSPFKTLLSTMLVNAFIKHRKTIIKGHEDDRPNEEDVNMSSYPFEEHGYTCHSVQSQLEGTLLSYKIERPVFPGFESDTEVLAQCHQSQSAATRRICDRGRGSQTRIRENREGRLPDRSRGGRTGGLTPEEQKGLIGVPDACPRFRHPVLWRKCGRLGHNPCAARSPATCLRAAE